jgi:hypothetical protein
LAITAGTLGAESTGGERRAITTVAHEMESVEHTATAAEHVVKNEASAIAHDGSAVKQAEAASVDAKQVEVSAAAPAEAGKPEEQLTRYAGGKESVTRLQTKADESLANPTEQIHGISTTASPANPDRAHSTVPRSQVEKAFRVHNTPQATDPLHRTVELPKPITTEIRDAWNKLWGLK